MIIKTNHTSKILFVCFVFSTFFPGVLLAEDSSSKKIEPTPDYKFVSQRSEYYKEIKNSPSSYNVWKNIRKSQAGFNEPLTLPSILSIALENNPTTRQFWEDARAAWAVKKQTQSRWFPQIDVESKFRKERTFSDQPLNRLNILDSENSANLTYLLFDFGGRSAQIDEASQILLSKDFLYNSAVEDLIYETQRAYYLLCYSMAEVEAARADVKTAGEVVYAAGKRLQAGVTTKLDLLQAQADYNNALYSLEDAKTKVDASRAMLTQKMAVPADLKFSVSEPVDIVDPKILQENISQLIEEAIQKRPSIAAAYADMKSKKAAVKSANSDLFPYLNLGGSIENDWYDYRSESPTSQNHDTDYLAYLKISWDVFDGFKKINKKRQAEAELRSAIERLNQIELQISADVWTKFSVFKASLSKLDYSQAMLEYNKSAYSLSFEGYKAGIKSILDLIQAQDRYIDAKNKVISSKQAVFITFAGVVHAVGRIDIPSERKSDT